MRGFRDSSRHLGLVLGLAILGPMWVTSAVLSALIWYAAGRRIARTGTTGSLVLGIASSAVGTLLGVGAVVVVGAVGLQLLDA